MRKEREEGYMQKIEKEEEWEEGEKEDRAGAVPGQREVSAVFPTLQPTCSDSRLPSS